MGVKKERTRWEGAVRSLAGMKEDVGSLRRKEEKEVIWAGWIQTGEVRDGAWEGDTRTLSCLSVF